MERRCRVSGDAAATQRSPHNPRRGDALHVVQRILNVTSLFAVEEVKVREIAVGLPPSQFRFAAGEAQELSSWPQW